VIDQDTDFRIAARQAPAAKAKQSAMIGSVELEVFTYYFPFQMADSNQRASVKAWLATRGAAIPMPAESTGVFFLLELDDVPILLAENDALPFILGVVLAKRGLEAARRVSYRPEMLPAAKG
jgi:hypothetical protein